MSAGAGGGTPVGGSAILLPLLSALVLVGLGLGYLQSAPSDSSHEVTVEPGSTLRAVARQLEHDGVIRSALAMRAWARLAGGDRQVRAGVYQIPPGEGMFRVLGRLRAGVPSPVMVTIPEGLTARMTAEIVARKLNLDEASYLAAVGDSALARELGVAADNLEGYLFPETYGVSPSATAYEFVRLQVSTFWTEFGPAWVRRAEEMGLSVHQVVTLASIIEREARIDEERARISAVFHNRLARGMRLQADPTVRFALGEWTRPLSRADLEVDSPYNTYLVAGIPPGPICSPGRASLEAALYPLPDSRELYFVARGDGTHLFSVTSREHEQARRRVR